MELFCAGLLLLSGGIVVRYIVRALRPGGCGKCGECGNCNSCRNKT